MTNHAHLRLVPDRTAETIARAVALIGGAREGHPPAHVERVAELAAAIAAEAGLDDEAVGAGRHVGVGRGTRSARFDPGRFEAVEAIPEADLLRC